MKDQFVMQACRGAKIDHGVDMTDSTSEKSEEDMLDSSTLRKIPVEADFFFAYSTVAGNKPDLPSLFFCNNLF